MSESANEQAQGGAYGEQQAEFSDAEERTTEQSTPSFGSDEEYGQQEARSGADDDAAPSAQETVEQTQGGFYRDENVEDEADGRL